MRGTRIVEPSGFEAAFGEIVDAYGRDPVVRAALRAFPLSARRPALALAVWTLRARFR